eukprot:TRINITY_DN668_c0_g1_i1.p1 TRINITY_DN668_c0_g1~~TRINITY_DN668_c0_g1_i1.p1  ORF type:complete len:351 (-),score=87.26 TRINITY_DN668_c0_g1_i1:360-1412(-)
MFSVRSRGQGVALGLLTGAVFGFALEKSKVALPTAIRTQMNFSNNLMLKMFLTATIVGMLGILIIERFTTRTRSPKAPVSLGFGSGFFRTFGGNIVGGATLGVGMVISGACPGTVFAQIGAGVQNAKWTLAGGYVGAIIYGYFEKYVKDRSSYGERAPAQTMDKVTSSPIAFPVAFAVLLLIVIAIAEAARGFRDELGSLSIDASQFATLAMEISSPAWSAVVAGSVIGLLQIPSFLMLGSPLGTSTSYVTLTGLFWGKVDSNVSSNAPYLQKYTETIKHFWQLSVVIGVVLGSWFSSTLSGMPGDLSNTSAAACFGGGMLLLFGSRMADGCTSGHVRPPLFFHDTHSLN